MERAQYTVTVDIVNTGMIKTQLRLKQGDSGIPLYIKVENNGNPYYDDKVLPQVYFRRPDRTTVFGNVQKGSDNKYLYVFKGSELNSSGTIIADVKFKHENGRESTASFSFECVTDTIGQATEPSNMIWNDIVETIEKAEIMLENSESVIAEMTKQAQDAAESADIATRAEETVVKNAASAASAAKTAESAATTAGKASENASKSESNCSAYANTASAAGELASESASIASKAASAVVLAEQNAKESEMNAKNWAESAEPVASTAQGLNPTLDNSTHAPFITFEGKGATIQDGEPTPDAPQEIHGVGESGSLEVKSTGANMLKLTEEKEVTNRGVTFTPVFDNNGLLQYININGTGTGSVSYNLCIISNTSIYSDGTYTISFGEEFAKTNAIMVVGYQQNEGDTNTYPVYIRGAVSSQFTLAENMWSVIIRIRCEEGDTFNNVKVYPMISKGNTALPYEPYTGTKANIPVSAPLYDGDYIKYNMDGTGGESRIQEKRVLNGTESWSTEGSGDTTYYATYIGAYGSVVDNKIKCTHFVQKAISSGNTNVGINVLNSPAANKARIVVRPGIDGVANRDTFVAWLAENPVEVICEKTEPTVTPLTAEQIAEFKKLQTFDGVTNVACEAEMEISYLADSEGGKAVALTINTAKEEAGMAEAKANNAQSAAMAAQTAANSKAPYETGTFNLRWVADTTRTILGYKYTKIGRLVIVHGTGNLDNGFSMSSASGNRPTFSGLPFPVSYAQESHFHFWPMSPPAYKPTNMVEDDFNFTIQNSSMVLHGDVNIQSKQHIALFGIYLTN